MSRAWNAFNRLLVERPVLTKAVVSGALFSTGDLIGQKIDGTWDKGYDVKRAARGFAWSACIFTPIAHVWYNKILEKTFAARGPLFKVLLDQGTFGPVMNAGFLGYTALVLGGGMEGVLKKWDSDLKNVLVANWAIWPALQYVNFRFVPPRLHVPVINVAVVFWSAYLAVVGNRKTGTTTEDDEDVESPEEALAIAMAVREALGTAPVQALPAAASSSSTTTAVTSSTKG